MINPSLSNVILEINNIKILDKLSFSIPKNKTTVFLGKNGSGKTSSLRCLNLLQKINSGTLSSFASKPIPMLFQKPLMFSGSVLYNFSILEKIKKFNPNLEWHNAFSLKKIHNQNIFDLSGGERQKVFLSRLMSLSSDKIIMDEPNQNLDFQSEKILIELLHNEKKKDKTIVLSLHDYSLAKEIADYVILLDQGKIILKENNQVFFKKLDNLRKSKLL